MPKRTGSESRRPVLLLLAGATALSWGAAAAIPHEGFHPLALLFVVRRP